MTKAKKIYQAVDSITNNSEYQKEIENMVSREVIHNASVLMDEMTEAEIDDFPKHQSVLAYAFVGNPDYEKAARGEGFPVTAMQLEKFFYKDDRDWRYWKNLCLEEGIDARNYHREVFNHWIVSDWLASNLEDQDEKIIHDFFGLTIWCRTTTDQIIALDDVIREIYFNSSKSRRKYTWIK